MFSEVVVGAAESFSVMSHCGRGSPWNAVLSALPVPPSQQDHACAGMCQ